MSRIFRSNIDRWGFFRRWRTYRANLTGIWDIISPVAVVDRDYPDEDEDLWGFRAISEIVGVAGAGELSSVMLYLNSAQTEDQEIYLRKLWFSTQADTSYDTAPPATNRGAQNELEDSAFTFGGFPEVYVGAWVHMFTTPAGYDPCANNTVFYFDFYNGDRKATFNNVLIRAGSQTGPAAYGVIELNLGPMYKSETNSGFNQANTTILDWDDPPLRLLSDRTLAIQCLAPATKLVVSGYFTMRLAHKPTFGP